MKSLVDNVAILAIENVILSRLPTILTSEVVLGLDSAVVAEIACETEESQQERTRTEKKLSSLQEGLNVLQQFRLQANSGSSLPFGFHIGIDILTLFFGEKNSRSSIGSRRTRRRVEFWYRGV